MAALLIGMSLLILSITSTVQGANACADIFQRAMQTLHNACADVGRNEACYGNQSITATLRDKGLTFDNIGARVAVNYIERLTASALDMQTGEWGLSLLKLKANLPDTMPGANVTFLVHGGTSMENVSGDMQVFYFTSSLGEPQCKQVPPSSIVVHSPNHERVTFVANGVEVNMGSTVVMSAQPNGKMTVYLEEGSVLLTSGGKTVSLKPGQVSEIQLGGIRGLDAVGVPSKPVTQQASAPSNDLINTVGDLFDEAKTTGSKGSTGDTGTSSNGGDTSTNPGTIPGSDNKSKGSGSSGNGISGNRKNGKESDYYNNGSKGRGDRDGRRDYDGKSSRGGRSKR